MKTKNLLLFFLLSIGMAGYSADVTITASNAGMSFSPNNGVVAINLGDVVHFNLGSNHDAVEVSKPTWDVNGTFPHTGFTVPFGGIVDVSNLSLGTHYYVCEPHASSGMKGSITVNLLGVNDFELAKSFLVFPNPAADLINIKAIDDSFDLPYCIIDGGGRKVFTGKLSDVTTSIDLNPLASGIYFLQVGEVRRATFRLIKK